jgi:hypothetical protein
MAARRKSDGLPAAARQELDRRLRDGGFKDSRELGAWLSEQGCTIAAAPVAKPGSKLEYQLELVRLATAHATEIVEASGEDCQISEALLRLVQQHLFAALVELEPSERHAVNVAALARSVAQMGRITLMHRRFAEELKAKVEARAAAAEAKMAQAIKREGGIGLTQPVCDEIRRVLLAIAE